MALSTSPKRQRKKADMSAQLKPNRDFEGATPEALAWALLRPTFRKVTKPRKKDRKADAAPKGEGRS